MPDVQIEFEVGGAWRDMFQEGLRAIASLRAKIVACKATIYEAEQEIAHMRHTMSVSVGLLEKVEGLPKSVSGYELNADGTKLIGHKSQEDKVTVEHVPDNEDPED